MLYFNKKITNIGCIRFRSLGLNEFKGFGIIHTCIYYRQRATTKTLINIYEATLIYRLILSKYAKQTAK